MEVVCYRRLLLGRLKKNNSVSVDMSLITLPQLQSYQTDLAQMTTFLWQPSHSSVSGPRPSPTAGIRSAGPTRTGPSGGRERVQRWWAGNAFTINLLTSQPEDLQTVPHSGLFTVWPISCQPDMSLQTADWSNREQKTCSHTGPVSLKVWRSPIETKHL